MADVGDVVMYTGNFKRTDGAMTKHLMETYLVSGDEYKILDICHSSYFITSFGADLHWSFWVPQTSFVSVDSRRFMEIKYGLI